VPSVDDHFEELPFDPDLDQGADVAPDGSTAHPAVRHSQKAIVLAVGIGGVFGAAARYAVSLAIPTPTGGFPWSTFLINVTGSAVLGALLVLLVDRFPRTGLTRPVVGTGVIGAYTTFSTFEIDAVSLVRAGHPETAALYVVATVMVGLVACWAGMTGVRSALQLERRLGGGA
jgi:CrcB protein